MSPRRSLAVGLLVNAEDLAADLLLHLLLRGRCPSLAQVLGIRRALWVFRSVRDANHLLG